ncbi:hypothetical protein K435DRAFT_807905 [Dendrothele bispora CBS 962.96]|uniref:Uncharacterized protein n=1 Tax=Dendrothele bispora (strain CBS 962.96) TaxID=1314807 RepID=A0A4S8L4G1_DENBC|nr:hypothetical protein K435DRAFT_807905 [Dendrothele bispora CBS 962.96]
MPSSGNNIQSTVNAPRQTPQEHAAATRKRKYDSLPYLKLLAHETFMLSPCLSKDILSSFSFIIILYEDPDTSDRMVTTCCFWQLRKPKAGSNMAVIMDQFTRDFSDTDSADPAAEDPADDADGGSSTS